MNLFPLRPGYIWSDTKIFLEVEGKVSVIRLKD